MLLRQRTLMCDMMKSCGKLVHDVIPFVFMVLLSWLVKRQLIGKSTSLYSFILLLVA